MDNLFIGKNEFVYWFGRVVDNADPLGIGRCRVRITGFHTDNEDDIPDDALPWAFPVTPITNAGIGGVGITPVGPQPNTKVFGFFLDGSAAQSPMILGVIQGMSITATEKNLSDGSTPQQPNTEPLVGNTPAVREGDCPDGYASETVTVNAIPLDTRQIQVDKSEWTIPFTGFVSSAYGERSGKHHGVDICPAAYFQQTDAGAAFLHGAAKGPTGLPVYAAADGKVVYVWTADKGQRGVPTTYDKTGTGSRSFGNAIAIEHHLSTGTYVTIYAHLGISQDAGKDPAGAGILVQKGATVKKGQMIGYAGRSHCYSSPTHLHFEIRVGSALPASQNHINPGKIFPQLLYRHQAPLKWMNSHKYNALIPFNVADAPVIAGQGPTL